MQLHLRYAGCFHCGMLAASAHASPPQHPSLAPGPLQGFQPFEVLREQRREVRGRPPEAGGAGASTSAAAARIEQLTMESESEMDWQPEDEDDEAAPAKQGRRRGERRRQGYGCVPRLTCTTQRLPFALNTLSVCLSLPPSEERRTD